jgi:hypothetical protein
MPDATIKQVSEFFKTGDPSRDALKAFSAEWKALSDQDKADLKAGIGNGTFTY